MGSNFQRLTHGAPQETREVGDEEELVAPTQEEKMKLIIVALSVLVVAGIIGCLVDCDDRDSSQ